MASEQARRENTTSEREIHVETDKVPKMTIHFESLAEQARQTPQEGADREGKARETHEEESQFESLTDKVRNEKEREEENEKRKEKYPDQARSRCIAEDRVAEAGERREKGSYAVGKFEVNVGEEKGAGKAKGREGEAETRSVEEGPEHRGEGMERGRKEESQQERGGRAEMIRSKEEGTQKGGGKEVSRKKWDKFSYLIYILIFFLPIVIGSSLIGMTGHYTKYLLIKIRSDELMISLLISY
jgi:hypothetical protein